MLGAGQTVSGVREFQRSEFTKEIFIGNGAEGHVYEVEHELNGSMAVKVFARGRAGLDQETLREIENIVKCNHHQNIIRFFGYVVEYFNEKRTITGYAMEHMADGSLHKVIHDPHIAYDSLDLAKWGRQAALALAWLHSQGIIHRDVKPHNMLLSDSRRLLKLCDFGCMRAGEEFSMTLGVGSLLYMAPELLRPLEAGRYSGKCDVYSMGITLWEMSTRKPPFCTVPSNRPPLELVPVAPLRDIIRPCYSENPELRPTMKELADKLKHFAEESAKSAALSNTHPIDPFIGPNGSPATTSIEDLSQTLTQSNFNNNRLEDTSELDNKVKEMTPQLATREAIQRQTKLEAKAKNTDNPKLLRREVNVQNTVTEVQHREVSLPQSSPKVDRRSDNLTSANKAKPTGLRKFVGNLFKRESPKTESEANTGSETSEGKKLEQSNKDIMKPQRYAHREQEETWLELAQKDCYFEDVIFAKINDSLSMIIRKMSLPSECSGELTINPSQNLMAYFCRSEHYNRQRYVRIWDLNGTEDENLSTEQISQRTRNIDILETGTWCSWSANGDRLITAGWSSNFLRIWKYNGELERTYNGTVEFKQLPGLPHFAKFNTSDSYILIAIYPRYIMVWDYVHEKLVQAFVIKQTNLGTHIEDCNIAWINEDTFVVLDKRINIFRVGTVQPIKIHGSKEAKIIRMAVDCIGEMIAAFDKKGRNLWVYSLTSDEPVYQYEAKTGSISSLQWSPKGNILACYIYATSIQIWNIREKVLLRSIRMDTHSKFTFSPNGRFIVSGGGKELEFINIWNIETGELLKQIQHAEGENVKCRFHWQGNKLFIHFAEYTIYIIDFVSTEESNESRKSLNM